jgi:hypothetical protein
LVDLQTLFGYLTPISLTIGVIYHIMTLRTNRRNQEIALKNQELSLKAQEHATETRQAQLFMNVYNQSFTNPQYIKSWTKVMETDWKNYEEFKAIYHLGEYKDTEFILAYDLVGGFFEGLGVLVRENLIDIRLVALLISGQTKVYWEKTQPIIDEFRRDFNAPRVWSETEYLYNELMRYLENTQNS